MLKDYKSERNPLKVHFLITLQALNLQFCQKRKSTTSIFQLICLPFTNTCLKENFKQKSNNFEMQYTMCYSRCIALHFQLLQLVRLTYRRLTFYETRMNRLMGQLLLSSAINKKERETLKIQRASTQWKV